MPKNGQNEYFVSIALASDGTRYGYTLFNADETTEDIAYTDAQSTSLVALLKSATLYQKTYSGFTWGRTPDARLTSPIYAIEFYRDVYNESPLFGVVTVNDRASYSIYYMPIDEFKEILDLDKSYLE
jgi:hypothetical protein